MILNEAFIFKHGLFTSCHASNLVETEESHIYATWFSGSYEGANDVAIWGAYFNGLNWSTPKIIALHQNIPCWNPVLFYLEQERALILNYKVGKSPKEWTGVIKFSYDNGVSWTDSIFLPAGIYGCTKNKPILLDSNRWICGSSTESYKKWSCYIDYTKDMGKSWQKFGPIIAESEDFGIIQPTLFIDNNNDLNMLCRSKNVGSICHSKINSKFDKWSLSSPTSLPNPNSAIDCVKLRDGRVLLVYNHSKQLYKAIDDTIPILGRDRLDLAISNDDGKTWQHKLIIEQGDNEYSYPCVIQAKSGLIHISYTWKRTNIKYIILSPNQI